MQPLFTFKLSDHVWASSLVSSAHNDNKINSIINFISAADILEIYSPCKLSYDVDISSEVSIQYEYKSNRVSGIKLNGFSKLVKESFANTEKAFRIDKLILFCLLVDKAGSKYFEIKNFLTAVFENLERDISLDIEKYVFQPSEMIENKSVKLKRYGGSYLRSC